MENPELTNLAETLAREMKAPIEIISEPGGNIKRVALPPGWKLEEKDDDAKLLAAPRRKLAKVRLHDAEGEIELVDTAGLRKRARVERGLEQMSTGAAIGA